MRNITITALVLASSLSLRAQEPSQEPPIPLPPGPLLRTAPEFAQWVVTITSSASEKTVPAEKPKPFQRRLVTIKAGSTRHDVASDFVGKILSDIWIIDQFQILIDPTTKTLRISTGAVVDAALPVRDFPELGWVSGKNYIGMQKVAGKDCLVFRDKVGLTEHGPKSNGAQQPPSGEMLSMMAYVDGETRLPVLIQKDIEIYSFQFGTPPSAALTPPLDLQQAITSLRRRQLRAAERPL